MWNDKPDRYPIPARNPTGTGMNFYPWVWVRVQISTLSLFAGGWVITLPNPNPTRCHPYSPWLQHPPTPHPSSCAGTPGEAQNRHPATALSTPTTVTRESFTPRTLVQSPCRWRLCPTPPIISPLYRKRGKRRIP
jgi:hypothetical protein